MKTTPFRFVFATATILSAASAGAVSYQWDANSSPGGLGGSGTWNATNSFWDDTTTGLNAGDDPTVVGALVLAGDTVTFGGTAGTVTLGGPTSIAGITFGLATGGYTLDSTGQTLTLGASGITAAAQTSGTTTLSGGTIALGATQSWALGNGTNTNTATSTLDLSTATISLGANNLTITSAGGSSGKTSDVKLGTFTGSGSLTLAGNFLTNSNFTISGNNTGFSGGVTVRFGTYNLNSFNALGTGAGAVNIAGGSNTNSTTLIFDNLPGALSTSRLFQNKSYNAATAPTVEIDNNDINSTHTLAFAGSGVTVSNNGSTIAGGSSTIFALGGSNTGSNTFAQQINDVTTGTNLITTSFKKNGAGTWILTGAGSNFSGTTSVTAGKLLVNCDLSLATGAVTVASVATLGGTGIVGGATTINGRILGGAGTAASGTLTINGNVTLASGSVVQLALGSGGAHSTLAFNGTETFQSNQAFNFLDFGTTIGSYNGLITGVTVDPTTSGWTISNAGYTGTFTWNSITSAIDLNLASVPEPPTYALMGAGALAAAAFVRRRSKGVNIAA